MDTNIYGDLLKTTNKFFDEIFTSKELQEEYDLLRNDNGARVLNVLKQFKDDKNFFLTKPFYENDYKPNNVPRVLIVRLNKDGFITCSINNMPDFNPYPIEPRFLVSLIFQSLEDETIRKEMHATKETEKGSIDIER